MAQKPRVFISHSAKEDAAKDLLDGLYQAIEAAGFTVLLDRKGLKPGQLWRPTLNVWMASCSAAVILFSKAALESDFVGYETSVLCYRNDVEGDRFLLIPVVLDGVKTAEIDTGRFHSAAIMAIQSAKERDDRSQVVADVLTELNAFAADHWSGSDPLERLVYEVRRMLPDDPGELEIAREKLDQNTRLSLPGLDIRTAVAAEMMSAGLDRAANAIRRIRTSLDAPRLQVEALSRVIGSSFVDHRSAKLTSESAKNHKPVCLAARRGLTAELYVLCASVIGDRQRPEDAWYFEFVDGEVGESPSEVVRDILDAFCRKWGEIAPAEAIEKIKNKGRNGEPVVAALPADGVDGKRIAAIRKALDKENLQGVTLFLLTGDRVLLESEAKKTGVEFLWPKLDVDVEKAHCDAIRNKMAFLTEGL